VPTHPAASLAFGASQQLDDGRTSKPFHEGAEIDGGAYEVPAPFDSSKKTKVIDKDGRVDELADAEAVKRQVYRDARELTQLDAETASLRHFYENKLIQEYTAVHFDQKQVEDLVQEYLNARVKTLMLKPKFAQAAQSTNGPIYLKVLREKVLDELKLTGGVDFSELDWEKTLEANKYDCSDGKFYDIASLYNMNEVNNEDAIGFQNLEARAANIDNNNEMAHESVFDKMLAEFFLQKRGDVKKGNKLINDLEETLGALKSSKEAGLLSGEPGDHTLGRQYQRQAHGKEDHPRLQQYKVNDLMKLDVALNNHLHHGKSALSVELKDLPEEPVMIPDYYDKFDVRMPADVYVSSKLNGILEEVFEGRLKLEKHLSRAELLAYDRVLSKYLKKDVLMQKLKREVYLDYNELSQHNQVRDHELDSKNSQELQLLKTKNEQAKFSDNLDDEDAYYKFLAYTGVLEKKRGENRKATLENPKLKYGLETFEEYYQEQLLADARRPPREIDHEALEPKRKTQGGNDDGFKTRVESRDQFFEDHALYRENQLEQKERIELYYVLEQMFQ